ncbi:MAG: aldose 1-epimerase family protein [Oscillospiraceae bacterium]|jgi:galactose mutarotase-like enzyme|nr:aldose 1-epimerase family protein [Oscillospiraceae bacterium]
MKTSIQSGHFCAAVDSAGAQLNSIALNGCEYLWQADPQWWPRQSPVLFPIVGCLRGGKAASAAGPCKMARHGLARHMEHELIEQKADALTYELVSTAETLKAYPYPFRLRMSYRITGPATLEMRFSVCNIGAQAMPFAVGGHPAFQVPAGPDKSEAYEDYDIRFAEKMTYASPMLDATGLLDFQNRVPLLQDTDTLPLVHKLFNHDALVFEKVPQNTVTLIGRKSGHGVRLDFPGFDYLGIWAPIGQAPFVALEPWTGCSTATDEDDCFEHKRGITILPPDETFERAFTITVF